MTERRRARAALDRRVLETSLPAARLEPTALPLMLPLLVVEVPADPGWLFELKWDGVRVLALRAGDRVRLYSRKPLDVTRQYPEVAAAVAALPGGDLALDGEIVALDEHGRPRFQLLQRRMRSTRGGAARTVVPIAYVYDCLALHGRDIRTLPLVARKEILRTLLEDGGGKRDVIRAARTTARHARRRSGTPVESGALRYADHVEGNGRAFLDAACAQGLEGVVAKRTDAPYLGGRRAEWRKIKCQHRQEFVIGGYTHPKGTRAHLGAVHLGVYDDGALVYAGRAGSGFGDASLRDLHRQLDALATPECPFTRGRPAGRDHRWVRPELVCEVRFTEWTEDGLLRHPVYLGLRPDRHAREVRREVAERR